eukprot:164512-Karenia_brevis.AAC.1
MLKMRVRRKKEMMQMLLIMLRRRIKRMTRDIIQLQLTISLQAARSTKIYAELHIIQLAFGSEIAVMQKMRMRRTMEMMQMLLIILPKKHKKMTWNIRQLQLTKGLQAARFAKVNVEPH